MVKESSVCSAYGMGELMFAAKNVSGTTLISVGPFVFIALIYFCINFPPARPSRPLKGGCAVATSGDLIRVEHVIKEFNHGAVKALNDCSLTIQKGEVVAIIGPSGSGKVHPAAVPEPAGGPLQRTHLLQ